MRLSIVYYDDNQETIQCITELQPHGTQVYDIALIINNDNKKINIPYYDLEVDLGAVVFVVCDENLQLLGHLTLHSVLFHLVDEGY